MTRPMQAIDFVKPDSPVMDALLALLLNESERVGVYGWHQPLKLSRDDAPTIFDLIDGEELGRTYRERWLAKHVTQKAAVHWLGHHAAIEAQIANVSGGKLLTHERHYHQALSRLPVGSAMESALRALLMLHNDLVRFHGLEEVK